MGGLKKSVSFAGHVNEWKREPVVSASSGRDGNDDDAADWLTPIDRSIKDAALAPLNNWLSTSSPAI
jgi:hypothetical protein